MADRLTIYNNALAEIAADPISNEDEVSLQARECRRVFPSILEEFLSWSDWGYSTVRVELALLTNDRLGEWIYRYAQPSDMAEANHILPKFEDQISWPDVGPFTTPGILALGAYPFEISGDSIYCNVENAILEYQSTEVQIGKIRALERRALELDLASRLAMPIKKSRELKGDLIKQAEVARARAVADNENRHPRIAPNYISPVEYAREGMIDGL